MRGTPLDEYLAETGGAPLTDAELDRQLMESQQYRPNNTAQRKPADKAPRSTAEEALSRVFSELESREERSGSVDTAIKTASNGVKVLAPLLRALTKSPGLANDPAKIELAMGQVLARVRTDALLVANAFGVTGEDSPPWLTAQISGQLMDILVGALERDNGIILQQKETSYLAPLLNLANQAEGINSGFYSAPANPQWQLINALTLATAEVMTEYHVFTYFNPDPQIVAQTITDYLNERVIIGTLDNMTTRFTLNDAERAYFGSSLLSSAGKLLAGAWTKNMAATLQLVKDMPQDSRRDVLVSGYPLDLVFDDFENMYQGLEISSESAIRSLAPNREIQNVSQSNAQALR